MVPYCVDELIAAFQLAGEFMSIILELAVALVAIVFVVSGLMDAINWRGSSAQFVRWGYPPYWPIVTGLLKIVAGFLAIYHPTQLPGLYLCSAITAAAILTVLVRRERSLYVPASGLTAVTWLVNLAAVVHVSAG